MDQDTSAGVEAAIHAAGGVQALGDALGISHVSVIKWRRRGVIPAERVAAVEKATGVTRTVLRPDLYPAWPARGFAEVQSPLEPQARALGLDPAAIAEAALRKAISEEKARRWAEENHAAIEAHNRYFEDNDTPLAKYRMF